MCHYELPITQDTKRYTIILVLILLFIIQNFSHASIFLKPNKSKTWKQTS